MIEIIGPLAPGLVAQTGKPMSLQKQLIERLQQAILSGRLPAGALLPSSRLLAAELDVSRNTVVIAYDHLAAQGYVIADRKGTRVSALSSPAMHRELACDTPPAPPALARRLAGFAGIGAQPAREALLRAGTPALDRFPLAAWRRSLERALQGARPHALGYGEPAGEPMLREAVAAHLRIARGVRCDGAQVVITGGAQEALNLCVTLLSNPGDVGWIEDPGYRGARAAFHAGDLRIVPMPVDQEGLAAPARAWRTQAPKLVYTTPAHQYPTGAVLSVARRLELIAQARRAGAWLIEDDYDGEFRHTGEPIASMQGLVPDAPVLYVGSFSKTMFPALRIGFAVLPRGIVEPSRLALQELLRGGHRLDQLALADFIASGEFARHLGRMRRLYRERQQVLRDALSRYFPQAPILGGNCGMHLTLRLPPHIVDRKVVELAQARQIGVGALSRFAIGGATQGNGLVIGYGNTSAQEIPGGVRVLARLASKAARPAAVRR
ncbi:PLP-dependent aminotransferase family protein [Pandoraea sp.]|uniref:MocR-like pyridoxine biosynthesis transcription factor PdxR n=1 Tax=Pandoraea sp. TaxID=1883445 RepID=UPI0011F975F9|nr:PLP-dependent aminotransferase family protein [Pandoraea sp.]TAL52038.1 MAG: PLP-dependent aminotransferase family protein [Pandoraea sp.]TAM17947.1 MAG: PLP-dependent aminotransferase family protein [Pandoraea sp.]